MSGTVSAPASLRKYSRARKSTTRPVDTLMPRSSSRQGSACTRLARAASSAEIRYPVVQLIDGQILYGLDILLQAFDDMGPLGTTHAAHDAVRGIWSISSNNLQILAHGTDDETLCQLTSL